MPERETPAPSIPLEEFAVINAAIDARLPRDEVLAEAGLSPQAWTAEQEKWLSKLAGQASSGELRSSKRYVELAGAQRPLAAEKARKARKKLKGPIPVAPVAIISPLHADAGGKLVPSAMLEVDPALSPHLPPPSAPPPELLPDSEANRTLPMGFLRPDASALPFSRASSEEKGPITAPMAPVRAEPALPFARSSAAAPTRTDRSPQFVSPSTLAGDEAESTLMASLSPFCEEALPFHQPGRGEKLMPSAMLAIDPAPSGSPPSPDAPEEARLDDDDQTLPVVPRYPSASALRRSTDDDDEADATVTAPMVPVRAGPALPFQSPKAAAASAPTETDGPLPFMSPDAIVWDGPESTAPAQLSPFRAAALPFQRSPGHLEPAPARPGTSPLARAPDSGTLPFRRPAAPSMPEPARPIDPGPAGLPGEALKRAQGTSLAEYANLCAGVRAFPEHVAWLQNQYGLDADTWKLLHATWRERFERDPTLQARWQNLIEQSLPRWTRGRMG